MSAPVIARPKAAAIDLAELARSKGWTVEITPSGKLRLSRNGSVVFVAGPDAAPATIAEAVARIEYIDGLMAAYRKSRP